MPFPKEVADLALLMCGRHCCICHEFKGTKIELHHISQRAKGGKDTFKNCIPVCFDCHSDIGSYNAEHPKGRKYSPSELKKHRDMWYAVMKKNDEKTPSSANTTTQNIHGNSNVVAGRDINITSKVTKKNQVIPDAGGRHITEKEAFAIRMEIKKYSDLMKEAGLNASPAKIYDRLYKHFEVPSYREIPAGRTEEAIKFIQVEIAKSRSKIRRPNPDAWRKQFYTPIYAASGQLGMSKQEVYDFANRELPVKKPVTSLKELTQKQLQTLDRKLKALVKASKTG